MNPAITFDLAGPANGKPGLYPWQKKNFRPAPGNWPGRPTAAQDF